MVALGGTTVQKCKEVNGEKVCENTAASADDVKSCADAQDESACQRTVRADWEEAWWQGDNLVYKGNVYKRMNYVSEINDEVTSNLSQYGALGVKANKNQFIYYQWQENSDCKDTLVFPPSTDLDKASAVRYFMVDTNFGRGCSAKAYDKKVKSPAETRALDEADKRQSTRDERWKNLVDNAKGICQQIDKSNVDNCVNKLKSSFNSCYDSLAGGNNAGKQDVDESALIDCMANKTSYSAGKLKYIFEPQYNSSVSDKCDVPGLGWIICWVSKFIGLLVDGLFSVLETMLTTPSLDQNSDGGKELYKVWSFFRGIANAILIIAFIVVIYSQVTNSGIDNYGLKKLLPRMIVSVVLINASFILCATIVDISNIIGSSIKDILTSVALPVKGNFNAWSSVVSLALIGAGAVIVYLNIFALVPIIFAGLFALLMTVVILTARQAILIILVMIAPIAFALNILPSGQKWFGKWWSSFIVLAALFPVIGFIFGATQVAAGVISAGTPDSGDPTVVIMFAVFALAVQSIPFFFVPLLIKFGGNIIGALTGMVNNPSKGLFDRAKGRATEWSSNKEKVRNTNALIGGGGLYGVVARRRNATQYIAKKHESDLKSHKQGAFGEFLANDERTQRAIADTLARNAGSGEAEKVREQALNDIGQIGVRLEVTDIDASEARWSGYNTDDLRTAVDDGIDKEGNAITANERAAAKKKLASQGNLDDIHKLINDMARTNASTAELDALARGIEQSGVAKSAAHLGPRGMQDLRTGRLQGEANAVGSMYFNTAQSGGYTPETMSRQSSKAMRGLADATAHFGDPKIIKSLQESQSTVRSKEKLSGRQSASTKREAARL